jgi:hypothetical protein
MDIKRIGIIVLLVLGAVTLLSLSYGKDPMGISLLAPSAAPASPEPSASVSATPGESARAVARRLTPPPSLVSSPSPLPQSVATGKTSALVKANSPCSFPLAYHIASIDPRFGLSQAQAVAALQRAEGIWESAFSNDIFAYDPGNTKGISVSFVFDQRQEEENKYREILSSIRATQADYDKLKGEYQLRQQTLGRMRADYDSHVRAYQDLEASFNALAQSYAAQSNAYRQEVASWNARGGVTSQADYDRLSKEGDAIQALYAQLKEQEASLNATSASLDTERLNLNQYISETNMLASKLNELANQLNITGATYNDAVRRIGDVVAGEGSPYEIRIFTFKDQNALASVLAHEMGHALGISGHANSSDSLMYYKSTSGDERLSLSQEDIALAQQACSNLVRK